MIDNEGDDDLEFDVDDEDWDSIDASEEGGGDNFEEDCKHNFVLLHPGNGYLPNPPDFILNWIIDGNFIFQHEKNYTVYALVYIGLL